MSFFGLVHYPFSKRAKRKGQIGLIASQTDFGGFVNPTDGVFALKYCPSVHQRDKAASWKNAICWISKYDFRSAGNQNTYAIID